MNSKTLEKVVFNLSNLLGVTHKSPSSVRKYINNAHADFVAGIIPEYAAGVALQLAAVDIWNEYGRDIDFNDFLGIPKDYNVIATAGEKVLSAAANIERITENLNKALSRYNSIKPENAKPDELSKVTARKNSAGEKVNELRNELAAAISERDAVELAAYNAVNNSGKVLFVTASIKCATDKAPAAYDAEKKKNGYIFSENGANNSVIYYYQIDWSSGLGGLQCLIDKIKVDEAKKGSENFEKEMQKREKVNETRAEKEQKEKVAAEQLAESAKRGDIINAAASNVSGLKSAFEKSLSTLETSKKELNSGKTSERNAQNAYTRASEKAAAGGATPDECKKLADTVQAASEKLEKATARLITLQGYLEKAETACRRAKFLYEFAQNAAAVVSGLPSVSLDDVTPKANLTGAHAV